jgi:hypothetical protein
LDVNMNSARHSFARSLLLLTVGLMGLTAPADQPVPPAALSPDEAVAGAPGAAGPGANEAVAGIRPEGRLRKLHLVRPDLIPYPIAYEVYC